jgi:hypothetical protein
MKICFTYAEKPHRERLVSQAHPPEEVLPNRNRTYGPLVLPPVDTADATSVLTRTEMLKGKPTIDSEQIPRQRRCTDGPRFVAESGGKNL